MEATDDTGSTQPFAHLEPRVRHISQSTIRKKWKPLPQSSQDRVRAILLSLKTKRAASGRIPPIGAKGKPRTTKKTKNDILDRDYEQAVEDVTDKSVPTSPKTFPPLPPTLNFPKSAILTNAPSNCIQTPLAPPTNALPHQRSILYIYININVRDRRALLLRSDAEPHLIPTIHAHDAPAIEPSVAPPDQTRAAGAETRQGRAREARGRAEEQLLAETEAGAWITSLGEGG